MEISVELLEKTKDDLKAKAEAIANLYDIASGIVVLMESDLENLISSYNTDKGELSTAEMADVIQELKVKCEANKDLIKKLRDVEFDYASSISMFEGGIGYV